jgi:tripartite-type tricarboxylate transporter receptor subunit TctC
MNFGRFGRRAVLLLSLACGLAGAQPTARIITGFPPGGAVDVLARIYADELSRELGRTYIVDTRSGAGGLIAMEALKNAPADGLSLLLATDSNVVIYPHTVKKPPYDSIKDFVAVGFAGSYDMALGVKKDARISDFKSFLNTARADKAIAAYGSPGLGTLPHFYGVMLSELANVQLTHVPYRGVGPAVTDLVGGALPSVLLPMGTLLAQNKSGGLRIVAISGEKRSPKLPDVPTFHELGYPSLDLKGWFGIFAPAGTPPAVLASLNDAINRIALKPSVIERLAVIDIDPRQVTLPEFATIVRTDSEKWAKVIKASGFTVDSP